MLIFQNVTKHVSEKAILSSVSFHVAPGECVALLGPNGAGKTTTMRLLIGLLNPTEGSIKADGILVQDRRTYLNSIGYVPDDPFFYEELTGKEFIQFTSDLQGKRNYSALLSRLEILIEGLDLRDVLDDKIYTYSLGMKKKLALIIALLNSPKYLLLDEPFNGIDPVSNFHIKKLLNDFCLHGGGVLISTHQLELVERLCDRMVILQNGELIYFDSLERFIGSSSNTLEGNLMNLITGSDRK